jgi:hypothetical protein
MLNPLFSLPLALAIVLSPQAGFSEQPFDIAPFAHRCCLTERHDSQTTFDYRYGRGTPLGFEKAGDHFVLGLQWAEERDVGNVRLIFSAPLEGSNLSLQYWYRNWPYPPPAMPTIEDPVDDPWQGRWLTAASRTWCEGTECSISFLPLASEENPRAKNLPGLTYRRTLKIRVISDRQLPLKNIKVLTRSVMKTTRVRLELGVGTTEPYVWKGRLTAYNGSITGAEGWHTAPTDVVRGTSFVLHTGPEPKGLVIGVQGTEARPPGSHDITIVTVWCGDRTFSFALPDVEKGSVYIPVFHAYLTLESNKESFAPTIVKRGARIRERLAAEAEQTYERARREIPPLDPVERQGGRLYLPLASDSSWQKFTFEWGGNITIDKRGVKAKVAELRRLEWKGDRISLRLGTGEKPSFRPRSADSRLSVLEDYLPLPTATWTTGQISYSEEAFVTQLSGPLGMQGRDEQVPSVLMAKITARNLAASPQVSHLWLGVDPPEELEFKDSLLLGGGGRLVRALIRPPASAAVSLAEAVEDRESMRGLHVETRIPAGEEDITYVALPFIPGLSQAERRQLTELTYEVERQRVIRYWENAAGDAVRFSVPEERFRSFSRAVVVHIHMSTTKDPKSGLLMVPAASYWYQVYANEACFQVLALDALGEHQTAADYLETLVRLQGSRPFEGTYTGDQRDVYHGARVDAEYDYTAFEYNLDHGTVLWTLAEHYFITRDRSWLEHVLPSMVRAADWVIQQRHLTMLKDGNDRIPEYGLLPAGHLEDNQDWGHWFSVNAFASAGMTRLGEAMLDIGHPDAERIRREAAAYREDLRTAVLRAAQLAPVQRLRDDSFVPYVPVRPHQRIRLFGPTRVAYYSRYPEKVLPTYRLSATREVLYGPMILLYAGVFRSREPLAEWVLDDWEDNATMSSSLGLNVHGWVDDGYWFSRGGMVFQANLQNPTLIYLRRHEIPAAIRNLYNDFVSCYYPDVNVFTEEYRQWRSPSGPFYKVSDEARFVNRVRDLLVLEDGQELWLTAGTPRRWLAPGQSISLDRMPTNFGPVSLQLASREGEITGWVLLPSRTKFDAAWLVLRVPEGTRLGRVEIDGKPWRDVDPAAGRIRLPMVAEPISLRATILPY